MLKGFIIIVNDFERLNLNDDYLMHFPPYMYFLLLKFKQILKYRFYNCCPGYLPL